MERKRLYWVVTALLVLFCVAARSPATPTMTYSWITRFEIPEQSIWERRLACGDKEELISKSAEVKPETSEVFAGTSVGINVTGSSGTVSGNVEGWIEASHPSYVEKPGPVNVNMSYAPIADESQIHTYLGANYTAWAKLYVDFPGPIDIRGTGVDLGENWIGLDVKEDFEASLGETGVASGASAPLAAASVGIVIGGAGVEANVYQEVFFTPLDIEGTMSYTHLETGESATEAFLISQDDTKIPVELDLDKPGYWEVEVTGLALHNTFFHKIGASVSAYAWTALVNPLARASLPLTLWENPAYELIVCDVRNLGRFNMYVGSGSAAPAVPVPGAAWLLGSGLCILAAGRRRFRRWADAS